MRRIGSVERRRRRPMYRPSVGRGEHRCYPYPTPAAGPAASPASSPEPEGAEVVAAVEDGAGGSGEALGGEAEVTQTQTADPADKLPDVAVESI